MISHHKDIIKLTETLEMMSLTLFVHLHAGEKIIEAIYDHNLLTVRVNLT